MRLLTVLTITSLTSMTLASSLASAQDLDRTKRPGLQAAPSIALPAIQKGTLKNGLAVWLVEQHKTPVVALNLVLSSGSDRDPIDTPGIATMTAEMLDAGTQTMNALQIAEELSFIGATFRVNAGTDGTSAAMLTLSKHLEQAVRLYSAIVTGASFPQSEFERIRKQRLTTLMQQKDRASTIASLAFDHIIYGGGHPYGNDPSGTEASLNKLTRDDLVRFYESYYRPNNATLIVVGDATMAELLPTLETGFAGWTPAAIPPAKSPPIPPPQKRRVYLIDKAGAPQSEIRIGYPSLARSTPDYFAVQVMNRLLGGQFSSRINMNLRERHGYTYGARSTFVFNRQPGPFVASGGFVTAKTDSSIRELLYEIDRMSAEGVTQEELEFSKKGMIGGFALSFETPLQIATALQSIVLYDLPENYYNRYMQNIESVTLADVQRVAHRYLDSSRMAVVVVGDTQTVAPAIEALGLGEIVRCDPEGNPLQN